MLIHASVAFDNENCVYFSYFNFVEGSKIVKLTLLDFVELHCFGTFLVVATVDSSFKKLQRFRISVVGKTQKKMGLGLIEPH